MKKPQITFLFPRRRQGESGQSLLETAFTLPLVLGVAFNLINLGYFWYIILTISAAPRVGVEYATQGGSAVQTVSAPGTTAVSNLVYENITNAVVGATTSNVSVQVCSSVKGVSPTTHVALCDTFGPAYSFPAAPADPEQPFYVLDRVAVAYTVTPVIPGSAFYVLLPSSLTFYRQASMRSLY